MVILLMAVIILVFSQMSFEYWDMIVNIAQVCVLSIVLPVIRVVIVRVRMVKGFMDCMLMIMNWLNITLVIVTMVELAVRWMICRQVGVVMVIVAVLAVIDGMLLMIEALTVVRWMMHGINVLMVAHDITFMMDILVLMLILLLNMQESMMLAVSVKAMFCMFCVTMVLSVVSMLAVFGASMV